MDKKEVTIVVKDKKVIAYGIDREKAMKQIKEQNITGHVFHRKMNTYYVGWLVKNKDIQFLN